MSQATDIVDRLSSAVAAKTKRALAKFLEISPSKINQAIDHDRVPDLWIYKVAVLTGYRVEWLRDGTAPRQYVELLHDAAAVTDHLWELQAEIERIATSQDQRLRLVHTVQDAASLIQAVTISEAAAHYQIGGETRIEISALDEEGRATVHRLIQALLHGDTQIKTHLIGQLKIIEDAVVARTRKDTSRKDKA